MDQQTLLITMAVFTGVAAVALIIQAGFLFGIYKAARGMNDKVTQLMPKIESLLEVSRRTIEESRVQIVDIAAKTSEILETARIQMRRVDEILEDASARAKVQMDRAGLILDDAMDRAQKTIALVEGGIVKPLREIQGVAAGIRTAFLFFMRGRPNPSKATSDEEMFI
jgi:hypothetical protein